MIDIVVPKNDESKFVQMAIKLGYDGLVFLYDQNSKKSLSSALELKEKEKRIKIFTAYATDKKRNLPKVDLFLTANSDRKFLKKGFDMVYDTELNIQDTMKQRQGGLNQVLCNLMKENKVSYCISFSSFLNSSRRADLIGKMMQNLLLCQKYNVRTCIASFANNVFEMKNPEDLKAFLDLLGAKDSKKVLSQLNNILEHKKKRMLAPGIEQI
ncbi:hypothetical protein GF371_00345 [Candidatus Woesearchaeota archaeon]|nr:hypothetical protein [Candidatus Woesearchaeota archaeon]